MWNLKKGFIDRKNINFKFDLLLPDFFAEKKYKEFGISLNDMSKLSNETVEKINNKIVVEEADTERKKNKFIIPLKLAITSGNGFVDTLVLLSVMATEIMIGIIIAVSIMKG